MIMHRSNLVLTSIGLIVALLLVNTIAFAENKSAVGKLSAGYQRLQQSDRAKSEGCGCIL